MAKTLREMANIYLGTYKINDAGNMLHHDSIHAMTGLGTGIADELRIIGVEVALKDSYNCESYFKAVEKAEWLLASVKYTYSEGMPDFRMNNGIEVPKYRALQQGTVNLDRNEIDEYFKLGRKIFAALKELTGKNYMALSQAEIGSIDVSQVDFRDEALAIKTKYMKPENRQTAILTARHLREMVKAEGKGLYVPRATSTWTKRAHSL